MIVRVHPVQVEVGRVKGEQEQEEDRGRRRRGALTRTWLIAPLVFLPGFVTRVLAVTSQPPSPARTSLPRGHVVRVSRAPPLPLVLDLQHLVTRSRPVVGYTASPNPSPTASSSSTPRSATSSSNCGAANAQRPSASTSHPRSRLCQSPSVSLSPSLTHSRPPAPAPAALSSSASKVRTASTHSRRSRIDHAGLSRPQATMTASPSTVSCPASSRRRAAATTASMTRAALASRPTRCARSPSSSCSSLTT